MFNIVTPSEIDTGQQPELSLCYLASHATPPNEAQIRLPPTFSTPPASPPDWDATPGDWFLGHWYYIASGNPAYREWRNMQWHLTPISLRDNTSSPSPQLQDVVSYDLEGGGGGGYLIYGIDTPVAPDAYRWVAAGPLAAQNNTWQVLAWGYDSADVAYAMFFETWPSGTNTPSQLYFVSRSDRGVAEDTYRSLLRGVTVLGDSELGEALDRVYPITQDGGRHGLPYPTCNATCMRNEYALPPQLSPDQPAR
ncbi:hypothetical protein UCDDS831_g08578 [Diplodia seriata]|uniref:Uncharacterized protein n=1 Tax=Diplodia seriata TaxID=420778 RepID=A0A0G2G9X8_9PEZI|nr:hypothetical protein UCDDS831_g08578 [Diplodia seriata]